MSHMLNNRTKSFTASTRSILCAPAPTNCSNLRSTSERFLAADGAAAMLAFFAEFLGQAGRFREFPAEAEASEAAAVATGGATQGDAAADADPSLRFERSCTWLLVLPGCMGFAGDSVLTTLRFFPCAGPCAPCAWVSLPCVVGSWAPVATEAAESRSLLIAASVSLFSPVPAAPPAP